MSDVKSRLVLKNLRARSRNLPAHPHHVSAAVRSKGDRFVNQFIHVRSLDHDYAFQLSLDLTSANYYYGETRFIFKGMDKISKVVQPFSKMIDKVFNRHYGDRVNASVVGNCLNAISFDVKEARKLLSSAYNLKSMVSQVLASNRHFIHKSARRDRQADPDQQLRDAEFLLNKMRNESSAVRDRIRLLKKINQRITNKQRNVFKKYLQARATISDFKNEVDDYMNHNFRIANGRHRQNRRTDWSSTTGAGRVKDRPRHAFKHAQFAHHETRTSRISESGSRSSRDAGARLYLSGKKLIARRHSQAYGRGYADARRGFLSRISPVDHKINVNSSVQCLTGFHFASYFLGGLNDARHQLGVNAALDDNVTYRLGYRAYRDGYQAGIKGQSNPSLKGRADNYRLAYRTAYHKAHRLYLTKFQAGQAAAQSDELAVGSLKQDSTGYVDGYLKAFSDKLSTQPLCLNSDETIKIYRAPDSRRHALVYPQQERAFRPVFKVTGITIDRDRNLYYKIANGYISADPRRLTRTYYQDLDSKHPKLMVIQPAGTYVYDDKKFDADSRIKYLRYGSKVSVDSVASYGGVTRFNLGHGRYVSSQKQIVKLIK